MRNRPRSSEDRWDEASPTSPSNMSKQLGAYRRRLLLSVMVLVLISLGYVALPLFDSNSQKPLLLKVGLAHRKLVHTYVEKVLGGECRPGFARKGIEARLQGSSHVTQPFMWKDTPLTPGMVEFPPPFGFRGVEAKLDKVLQLLPQPAPGHTPHQAGAGCRRCVVMGNGGILQGLGLGDLINRFDVVIRLNSGPLGVYSPDVGNRTSLRMSYPEGSPRTWTDLEPDTLFVGAIYKAVDLAWLQAMVSGQAVSLWDRLFFWQKVPTHIPVEVSRFRVLNLEVIREVALELLSYPTPQPRFWGWDQNVPTLGATALRLASLLCDEVSLAGFGYNFSQQGAPLHYYDSLPMTAMMQQDMHNVDRERTLLRSLAREGTITDLTWGLHRPS